MIYFRHTYITNYTISLLSVLYKSYLMLYHVSANSELFIHTVQCPVIIANLYSAANKYFCPLSVCRILTKQNKQLGYTPYIPLSKRGIVKKFNVDSQRQDTGYSDCVRVGNNTFLRARPRLLWKAYSFPKSYPWESTLSCFGK